MDQGAMAMKECSAFPRVAVGVFYSPSQLKEFYIFPKNISSKMNIVARLDFEPAYNYVAVQHVSHYATETPPVRLSFKTS